MSSSPASRSMLPSPSATSSNSPVPSNRPGQNCQPGWLKGAASVCVGITSVGQCVEPVVHHLSAYGGNLCRVHIQGLGWCDQLVENDWQVIAEINRWIHHVLQWNMTLEVRRQHEVQKLSGKRLVVGAFHQGRDFHLQVMQIGRASCKGKRV